MESGRFGAYRIEELIGRGGMGEVYRPSTPSTAGPSRSRVLSSGLAGDAGYRERFRREAHAVARLSEPHVIPIHRYGEVDGRLFLDMRLVQGVDLGDLLHREGALEPARAVAVVAQVARALDAAHAEGLVHPRRQALQRAGHRRPGRRVRLPGRLRIAGRRSSSIASPGSSLTQTGSAVGSFDYMAPERFMERPSTPAPTSTRWPACCSSAWPAGGPSPARAWPR